MPESAATIPHLPLNQGKQVRFEKRFSKDEPSDFPDTGNLLEGIPPEKHSAVLRCLHARTSFFSEGERLASRNALASYTRYLVSGAARIERYDLFGNRSILGSCEKGAVVGSDLTPLLYAETGIDIIAAENCTTIDFSITQEIEGCACCLKYVNQVKGNIINSLAASNLQLMHRLDTLSCRSTRDKVLSYLQEQCDQAGQETIEIPFNRRELADFLCIERSALSRELSKMQREGVISFEKNRFRLI